MEIGLSAVFHIIFLLIVLDLILMFLIFFNKKRHKIKREKVEKMDYYIIKEMIGKKRIPFEKGCKIIFRAIYCIKADFLF